MNVAFVGLPEHVWIDSITKTDSTCVAQHCWLTALLVRLFAGTLQAYSTAGLLTATATAAAGSDGLEMAHLYWQHADQHLYGHAIAVRMSYSNAAFHWQKITANMAEVRAWEF